MDYEVVYSRLKDGRYKAALKGLERYNYFAIGDTIELALANLKKEYPNFFKSAEAV